MREAVIVSTARTPIGRAYRGAFNDTQAQTLGGHAIAKAVSARRIDPARSRTSSWARRSSRARRASTSRARPLLRAGLPDSVAGMSLDRQCASGLMAIATAAKQIIDDGMQHHRRRRARVDFAGAERQDEPLTRAGSGSSSIATPTLYMPMIETAEIVAERYNITREAQDEYALRSPATHRRRAGRWPVRRRDRARCATDDAGHRQGDRRTSPTRRSP